MASDKFVESNPVHWAGLIEAIAATQSRDAFSDLFAYFAPRVKTFMCRSGATDALADELAQETMLTVWRKASQFDPTTMGAAAWIFTIARNLRVDALRYDSRRRLTFGLEGIGDAFLIDEAPQPDRSFALGQVKSRVQTALANLSDDQLRVVELSFYEERAHAEIAAILKIPLGTVKSRLRLAMTRLRALLEDFS